LNISRQFALGIATVAILVSLGFVTVSHSVDQSHMTPFLHYFWLAIQSLIALAVVLLVNATSRIAIISYLPNVENDHPFLSGIANFVECVWLFGFWPERLFWGIAAALVLLALGLIRFKWIMMGWLRH
jgi:hypothetical protein